MSVQIGTAVSLFPAHGSRWVCLDRILLSESRLGPACRFALEPGSERDSGLRSWFGRTDSGTVSVKIRLVPPR